jgi:prepilin-type N-terminal cleavage/methylation domain-containing protein
MPRRSAFTLLELILVLALIVMVLAWAYPSLDAYVTDARLKAGADHLRARFAEARSHAILENQPYVFGVKPGESGYRLAPDDGTDSTANANPDDHPDSVVVEDQMPNGIRFNLDSASVAGASSNGYVGILTFMPDGTCTDDKTIRLDLEGAVPIEISVRGLTGAVTVRSITGDNR